MEVDVARARANQNPEEMEKLQKEERCFNCKLQGHMFKNCPKRREAVSKSQTTDTEETPTKQQPLEVLVTKIKELSGEEKEDLMGRLLEGQDF